MLQQEVKDTNNECATRNLLEKITDVQLIEDNDAMFTESEEDKETDIDVTLTEVEVETEVKSKKKANQFTTVASVYRLTQEMPTRWNSCLTMMRSLQNDV